MPLYDGTTLDEAAAIIEGYSHDAEAVPNGAFGDGGFAYVDVDQQLGAAQLGALLDHGIVAMAVGEQTRMSTSTHEHGVRVWLYALDVGVDVDFESLDRP